MNDIRVPASGTGARSAWHRGGGGGGGGGGSAQPFLFGFVSHGVTVSVPSEPDLICRRCCRAACVRASTERAAVGNRQTHLRR